MLACAYIVYIYQMIEYLESCNVKYTIVHTKCDVAGTPKRLAQVTFPYLGESMQHTMMHAPCTLREVTYP